jgi:hypothetical protein
LVSIIKPASSKSCFPAGSMPSLANILIMVIMSLSHQVIESLKSNNDLMTK